MKGLILAGGHGTRLRPLTHTGPKQLIPIANKPILFYAIEDLVNAGIIDIGMIVGYTEERINAIKEAVGDGSKFGAKITYIEQDAPRGIAHAVGITEEFMAGEPFAVYLGDNLLKGGINTFVNEFKNSNFEASILLCHVKNPQQFGVAELENGRIVKLEEKPKQPKSDLAMVGVYLFKPSIFDSIRALKPSWRNELEITEAIDDLVQKTHNVQAHVVQGWWKDTGKPEDILEANHLVLEDIQHDIKGTIEEGAKIIGRVSIGAGTTVKTNTLIRGPVLIGENCEIGPHAYIGPYTSIGNKTRIREAEIESSIIMSDTQVECKKRITDSLVGGHTQILSNGQSPQKAIKLVIGENSIIKI
ncbi:MAG: glucose-1-phosphate thymidylyltransferase [Candidatus Omnitrophica bacterium]|nr:glucose-1-phosphate thymidylyltransferase [Candidatus Omnitrophota bacterium]